MDYSKVFFCNNLFQYFSEICSIILEVSQSSIREQIINPLYFKTVKNILIHILKFIKWLNETDFFELMKYINLNVKLNQN